MKEYLDFKKASCKNCHKCLRECPVKAIEFANHQAKIISDRCILCGKCTLVCPQNAKYVHSELDEVKALLKNNDKVIVSLAPSFVSSFKISSFAIMSNALKDLGFYYAEETAVGANAVINEYDKILKTKKYKNFITSACPSVNRLLQIHFPKALEFLAPVDSPMVAHAKILKKKYNDCKIVFIGPCIAKKQEARLSGLINNVLTFEELQQLFVQNNIKLQNYNNLFLEENNTLINKAQYFPISRGIIKSFETLPDGYEYVAVDGVNHCMEVLKNIDKLSGMFIELNACEYACVNGPCSLNKDGESLIGNADIRKFVTLNNNSNFKKLQINNNEYNFITTHNRMKSESKDISEREIKEILAKTGKFKKEDELNCGMCGYSTCREKAWAVANGYAEVEMCVPYMRERAESLSFEVIDNSPNGIVVLDNELKILQINQKAKELWGITDKDTKGQNLVDYCNPTEFVLALYENQPMMNKRLFIPKTEKYVELSISILKEHQVVFGVFKDITSHVNYDEKLAEMRLETYEITDNVIKKQMRVAQEIASLLGETTAETKVALLNLKKSLKAEQVDEQIDNKGEQENKKG